MPVELGRIIYTAATYGALAFVFTIIMGVAA